ncbi:50S ribosomal protein L30 [Candidatus Woesearchaeota archaeon]|nr:50S ribosomal protein L30 [Candidatus Woesearchaeota archaeon]
MMTKIAVVRVRGNIKLKHEIKSALNMLRLYNKNYCAVLEKTPLNLGMIRKVNNFVTYGEIEDSFFNEIIEKKGEEYKGREKDVKGKISYGRRYLVHNNKKYKKYFRLSPPRKGYGRKGTKQHFTRGGALGYRGKKIHQLIKRML